MRIIISRTDSIGDVLLTLPLCSAIKDQNPETEILFLGKNYTKEIIEAFKDVDQFISWDDLLNNPLTRRVAILKELHADAIIHVFPRKEIASLAKKAKIPKRIGTSHRSFHLLTCNTLVNFTRKRSDLHESQLNFQLLKPLGITEIPSLDKLISFSSKFHPPKVELPESLEKFIAKNKTFVILHPKSQGSALEWPINKYVELSLKIIDRDRAVIFTGTEKEGALFRQSLTINDKIYDSTGQLTLSQLLYLISLAQALVACSTGPLHIAAFLGKRSIGLYAPKRPIHPGRWKPLGKFATALVYDPACETCRKKKACNCIEKIEVQTVLSELLKD